MSPWETRARHLVAILAVIGCGLVLRRPELGLPWSFAKYGGSVLWGAMVFLIVAGLAIRWPLGRVAFVAAAIAAAVELSQLIHVGPLDEARRTVIGALLLGRTFAWWDIASYWGGIGAAALASTIFRGGLPASLHTRL